MTTLRTQLKRTIHLALLSGAMLAGYALSQGEQHYCHATLNDYRAVNGDLEAKNRSYNAVMQMAEAMTPSAVRGMK